MDMELTEKIQEYGKSEKDPENPTLHHRSSAVAPAPMTKESPTPYVGSEGKITPIFNVVSSKSDSSTHDLHNAEVTETVTGGPNVNEAYEGSSENISHSSRL